MRIIPNTHFSSQNLMEPIEESYTETAKRYLDNVISIIASYAPLITFWTTLLYTIPEIEAYAIMKDVATTTTTPETDQVDIRLAPFTTTTPCPDSQMGFRATDITICYKPTKK